ncbi:hypothetical protein NW765_009554 [Fusarium oxysporum]|nr:hypothetical protein NW765_009554 [Fusarium oxysporum]
MCSMQHSVRDFVGLVLGVTSQGWFTSVLHSVSPWAYCVVFGGWWRPFSPRPQPGVPRAIRGSVMHAATRHQNPTIIMGLLAKLKFKLRKRLAQGTVEPVAYGILGLVSLERVCKNMSLQAVHLHLLPTNLLST